MVLQQLLGANAGVPGWVPVRGQLQRQVPVLLRHPPHLPAPTARHLHHPRRACHPVTVSRRSGTVPSAASRDRSRSQHFGIPGKHGSLSRAVLRQVGHKASRNRRSGALLRRQSLPSCAGPRHRAWEAPIDRASHSCIIHHKPGPAWAQWAWRNNPAFSVQACMPNCVRMRVDSWSCGQSGAALRHRGEPRCCEIAAAQDTWTERKSRALRGTAGGLPGARCRS